MKTPATTSPASPVSSYEQSAAAFLTKHGITFRATLAKIQKAPAWADEKGIHGSRYRITLSGSKPKARRLSFDFWGSYAKTRSPEQNAAAIKAATEKAVLHERKVSEATYWSAENRRNVPFHQREAEAARREIATLKAYTSEGPTPYDALSCISSDINTPETFADFCAEYGYDEDSRKAHATFKRCAAFAVRLRAFFASDAEREDLAEIQ